MRIEIDTTTRTVRINNDAGFEQKHPRDDNGKFTKSRILHIVSKPVSDLKAEQKKVEQWYRDNLQGKTVEHKELGTILFSRKGINHTLHTSASTKLALVKYLPEIISTGTTSGWQELNHTTDDEAIAIAPIFNTIILNGQKQQIGCLVRKYPNNKIYYDLFISKTVATYHKSEGGVNNGSDNSIVKTDRTKVNQNKYDHQIKEPELVSAITNAGVTQVSNNSISPEKWVVNLFIDYQ